MTTAVAVKPRRFFIAVELSLLQKLCPNWVDFIKQEGRDLILPEAVELTQKEDATFALQVYE